MKDHIVPMTQNATANQCKVAHLFDEDMFSPDDCQRSEYFARVVTGYNTMRGRRVVIGGLARNIEPVLPLTVQRIEHLAQYFSDYRVVLYENDSADATFSMLRDWTHNNSRVTVISESLADPVHRPSRCLSRARRMAYYRSRCQAHIRECHREFDNVILVDTDLDGGWSIDGVANTFGHADWDFVGAYGVIFRRNLLSPNCLAHYDAWAYRVDDRFTPMETKEVNRIHFRRGEPLHPVTSCFGGLGVYRMSAYLAGEYDGADVEHVTFHRHMRRQGFAKTYLNPSQIAVYGRKHRTLDAVAAKVIRLVDAVPGRAPTAWHYARAGNPDGRGRKAG